MSIGVVMLISLIIVILTIISGVPMPFVFFGASIWVVLVMGLEPKLISQVGYASVSSYILISIPLFIIGGVLMSKSRMGIYLINWFDCFLGRIKGSMVIISTLAFVVFSAVSGSGLAILACLCPILFPRMVEKGYPPDVVASMLCCSAPLGLLFPPSIAQIMFAWAANISVMACFLAIIIPGILTATGIAIVCIIACRKMAPDMVISEKVSLPIWRKKTLSMTGKAMPALLMPVIILGGIYSGIMTITESAAVAAVYAMIVAIFIYRDISPKDVTNVLSEAGVTSGVIMLLLFFVLPFSRLILQEGLPKLILDLLLSISENKSVILLMINIFMILLGMFMDDDCGVLLVAIILTPVARAIGVSPYQFAAIVGINLGFGIITPPTAPYIYFTARMTGIPVINLFKWSLLIIALVYLPVLMLTTYVPQLALGIPTLVLGEKFLLF